MSDICRSEGGKASYLDTENHLHRCPFLAWHYLVFGVDVDCTRRKLSKALTQAGPLG